MSGNQALTNTDKKSVDWSFLCSKTKVSVPIPVNPPEEVYISQQQCRMLQVGITIVPKLPMLAKAVHGCNAIKKISTIGLTQETKFDGERVLCLANNQPSKSFFSRTLKSITINEFNIQLCPKVQMVILDGERVYIDPDSNKPVAICNTGYRKRLKQMFMVFDIQAFNNEYVMHLSLKERRNLLHKCIIENTSVSIVKWANVTNSLFADFEDAINNGYEGLVLKYKHSNYFSNQRTDWIKMKPLYLESRLEIDLFAISANRNCNNEWSILNCGYFKNNEFVHVCSVSSGMRDVDKNRINLFVKDDSGLFVKPIIVALVADSVTTHNQSLRHPQFLRFCPEKSQVTFPQYD